MQTHRLFIGSFVDKHVFNGHYDEIRDSLFEVTKGNWVNYDILHFTYKFLGDIAETEIKILSGIIRECLGDFRAEVVFKGLGGFPNINRPRILYADIINKDNKLKRIFNDIESKLVQIGFDKESRRFNPHVTLQRIKELPPPDFAKVVNQFSDKVFGKMSRVRVNLIESKLTNNGPEYSVIM